LNKNDVLEICSELYDKLSTVKGFVELQKEYNHTLYSTAILHELEGIDKLVSQLVVKANELTDRI